MRELALFAGAGGGILGGKLLGWRTVCAVEIDGYARSVLVARQNDGSIGPFPIWDDVRTFDGKPWRGSVDLVSGGFPCQDISIAGKGAGITGARSGLWREMARIIREVGPSFVFIENSPMLVHRGLDAVLRDLAEMGFNVRWCCLGAADAGAPHKRERIWILANAKSGRQPMRRRTQGKGRHALWGNLSPKGKQVRHADRQGLEIGESQSDDHGSEQPTVERAGWWESEPKLGRVAHGVADRVDRLKCIGNGQVPAVVKLAWETLTADL